LRDNVHRSLPVALSGEELLQAGCRSEDLKHASAWFLHRTDADDPAEPAQGTL